MKGLQPSTGQLVRNLSGLVRADRTDDPPPFREGLSGVRVSGADMGQKEHNDVD
jgi:hypothetical protein